MGRKRTVAFGVLLGLVGLWVVFCAMAYAAMVQPPEEFARIMARVPGVMAMALPFETLWLRARAGRLAVGDAAPDFLLESKDRHSQVQLSSFRGKQPVVLVFGSYT